MTTSNITRYP